jgi:hypothetical protein
MTRLNSWYSMTERHNAGPRSGDQQFVAWTRDDLAVYWQQRQRQHEHLELRRLQVNSWEPERGLVHFGPLVVSRRADDLAPPPSGSSGQAVGKGAFHCATRTFVVISLAMGSE